MSHLQMPEIFFATVSFVFGSVVGSFLNVCIYRIPRGESIVYPASRCPKCSHSIQWYDNIPIISWFILRGKCRHCGESISWQYPLVESLTAVLFLLIFLRFRFVWATPIYMAFTAALILVAFVDFAEWIIPDEVTLPGIPLALICALLATWHPDSGLRVLGATNPVFDAIIGIEAGGVLFLLDKLARLMLNKPGMGGGDIKLLAMIGGLLGWGGAFLTVFVAAVFGSLIGLIVLLVTKKQEEESADASLSSTKKIGFGDWYGMPGTILITATFSFLAMFGRKKTEPDSSKNEDDEDAHKITLAGHYLPFGPYLCLGALVVMFYGKEIVDFYLSALDVGL